MSKPLPNPEFDAAPVLLNKAERAALSKGERIKLRDAYTGPETAWPVTVKLRHGKTVTFASFEEWWKLKGIIEREGLAASKAKAKPRTEGQKAYIRELVRMGWL